MAALAVGGRAPSAAAFRRQRHALAAAAFAECDAAHTPKCSAVLWLSCRAQKWQLLSWSACPPHHRCA